MSVSPRSSTGAAQASSSTPPTLNVAILGAGMIGRAHARAFRALRGAFQPAPAIVNLVAIADADLALARDAQLRWEIDRLASSWREIADMPDVHVVCVALPNFEHREAVEALVGAGKHVLCEKPLAVTSADARAMLEAATRSGVIHGIGFNLRRAPAVAAIHAAIAEGHLGELRQFSGRYLTDYGANPQVPFTWRYQRSLAGSGALGDIGTHLIDMARYLVGEIASVGGASLATFIQQRPVPAGHVTGHNLGATTGEVRAVDTDDVAAFTCAFESGAVGDFRFSRIATGYRNSPSFELIGARGSVSFDMERAAEFAICLDAAAGSGGSDNSGGSGGSGGSGDSGGSGGSGGLGERLQGFRRVVTGPRHPYFNEVVAFPVAGVGYGYAETYLAQAYEFVRAVAEQRPYSPSFEDGVAVMEVCEAVQQAATMPTTV